MKRTCLLAALLSITACVDAADPGTLDEDINGPSSDASAWQRARAVVIRMYATGPHCTGTKIAADYVLSASHCLYHAGDTVYYYGNSSVGSSLPILQTAQVDGVFMPPGVDGDASLSDTSGKFADLAILHVDRFDTFGQSATLSWTYPGANAAGLKVGAGQHDDDPLQDTPNPDGILLQVPDTTTTADGSDGVFRTQYIRVNHGDSGGPFYYGGRVLGVLNGMWYGQSAARYTAVPVHLDWILSTIGYHWSGAPPLVRNYTGATLETFTGTTEQVCQYACDQRSDCQAYDFKASPAAQCWLVGNVTGTSSDGTIRGALHYAGARASRTADVVGYLRSDGVEAIVHTATNGHVHELHRAGTAWSTVDLSGATTPAPSSRLTAYRRADGVNAVVYRSSSQLFELALLVDGWHTFTFPILDGTVPAGDPAAYVRADGLSAVVYRTTTNHLVEVSQVGAASASGWAPRDLTALTGAPLASSDPTAFVRSDGVSSIVYRSGDQIFELFMTPSHAYDWGEPSALAPNAPAAIGKPAGYSHHDGTNAIVYTTTANRVEELWLDGLGWHAGDIHGTAAASTGDVVPYVRTDGVESVLHWSWSLLAGGHVWESANIAPWTAFDLSASGGSGPVPTSSLSPFLSHDGWNIVPVGGNQNHAGELFYAINTAWGFLDLTTRTGETP